LESFSVEIMLPISTWPVFALCKIEIHQGSNLALTNCKSQCNIHVDYLRAHKRVLLYSSIC